ncbi:MAG: asparagine synthase (glutamine-hydrolyzing) [Candidatus Omnitrophica bacterium]|nr:asparagine synthase (glutamine-hydrolyzing) [Candidatus Omnitrophota bacterium]
MCGICGYVYLDKTKSPSGAILKVMMDSLAHRGPDDEGLHIKDNVALGQRRLSIIDVKNGHQPIFNEDKSIVIIYNGEIYNFRQLREVLLKRGHIFSTDSDTEVALHAYEEYGDDCLKYFNGMFAFAIWDNKLKRLFLARDRFGKKPLYYGIFDNQFIFASELKAILKHPALKREIDLAAVSRYLAYEYIPSPSSIFKNISKLEAGTKLFLKDGACKIESYWDLNFGRNENRDVREIESRLVSMFKESVRKRLISDVPLGVFLSGGIDSSAVVSMMAELMDPKEIKTFSIGFKEASYDESSDARGIAKYFGTEHHEEILRPRAMLDIFPAVLDALDEPFADSSIIPTYLVSAFTRKFVKVALGGDGGDELFLGYPSFRAHKLSGLLKAIPKDLAKLPFEILTRLAPLSRTHGGMNYKARQFLRGIDYPEEVRHQAWIGSFLPEEQKALFAPGSGIDFNPFCIYGPTDRYYKAAGAADLLDKISYVHIKTYLSDDILTKVDRASMANSLEVRAPFLDTELAEYVVTIPNWFKLRNFTSKWILKRALKDKLPSSTLNKKKRGFAVPVAEWLKEDLKGLLLAAFEKRKIEREGIFNYSYIKGLLTQHFGNRHDVRKEIWSLFLFEMWYDRWMR